jgi:hypothetical protein
MRGRTGRPFYRFTGRGTAQKTGPPAGLGLPGGAKPAGGPVVMTVLGQGLVMVVLGVNL